MGRVREGLLEEEEYTARTGLVAGLEVGRKFAGPHVSDDLYVQRYIRQNGKPGICSYTGKAVPVVDVVRLAEWVVSKIDRYFTNPDNDALFLDSSQFDDGNEADQSLPFKKVGHYVTRKEALVYDSTFDLLSSFRFSNRTDLTRDVAACISNDYWINRDSFDLRDDEKLSYYWQFFAAQVKKAGAYAPSAVSQYLSAFDGTGERTFDEILDDIVYILHFHHCFTQLPAGYRLYRCRNISHRSEIEDSFRDMTSAPPAKAFANRMSRRGESMFYASCHADVCLVEAVDPDKPVKAVAEFQLKRNLFVLDLTDLPTPSLWSDFNMWAVNFLHMFTNFVSENFDEYTKVQKEREYIPTQVFTDYIRTLREPATGQRVDGLIYFSSKVNSEKNVVLFIDDQTSAGYVRLNTLRFIGPDKG